MKKILIFNGSPHGKKGNSQKLVLQISKYLKGHAQVEAVCLQESANSPKLLGKIHDADGFVFVTGTYWDSWGSPLQIFLENITELEGTEAVMGKPCAVVVLMHSVGGKSILSRLQGVLSSMGFLIPPMSGMVYSLVSDLAMKKRSSEPKDDFWDLADVLNVIENLRLALEINVGWRSWPVDRKNFRKTWLK
jgi:multimeric flavodoxin WrbA